MESASAGFEAVAVPKPDAREEAGADDDEEAGPGADDAPIGAETTALAPPRPSAGARPEGEVQVRLRDPEAPSKKDRMSEPVQPTMLCEEEDEGASDAAVVAPPSSPEQSEILGLEDFEYNETYGEVLRCPAGQVPIEQITDKKGKTVWARFSAESCASCPFAAGCPTRRREDGVRTFRWQRAKAATACRQREQQGAAFKERYKIRSGIEATNAELKGRHGARRLRVRGQERVDLAIRMKALAVNAKRASEHRAACLRASDGQAKEVEQPLEASRTGAVAELDAAILVGQDEHREPAPPRAEADVHVTAIQASTSPPGLASDAHVSPPPVSTSPPPQVIERGVPPSPPNTATHPRPPSILRALGRRLTRAFEQRAKQVDMLLAPLLQGVSTGA